MIVENELENGIDIKITTCNSYYSSLWLDMKNQEKKVCSKSVGTHKEISDRNFFSLDQGKEYVFCEQ